MNTDIIRKALSLVDTEHPNTLPGAEEAVQQALAEVGAIELAEAQRHVYGCPHKANVNTDVVCSCAVLRLDTERLLREVREGR